MMLALGIASTRVETTRRLLRQTDGTEHRHLPQGESMHGVARHGGPAQHGVGVSDSKSPISNNKRRGALKRRKEVRYIPRQHHAKILTMMLS
jgi:hypothetical protein